MWKKSTWLSCIGHWREFAVELPTPHPKEKDDYILQKVGKNYTQTWPVKHSLRRAGQRILNRKVSFFHLCVISCPWFSWLRKVTTHNNLRGQGKVVICILCLWNRRKGLTGGEQGMIYQKAVGGKVHRDKEIRIGGAWEGYPQKFASVLGRTLNHLQVRARDYI